MSNAELERAIVAAGGCAAGMRTCEEWLNHPQGIAVASQPLIHFSEAAPLASVEVRFTSCHDAILSRRLGAFQRRAATGEQ